jgi:hypothetical protein
MQFLPAKRLLYLVPQTLLSSSQSRADNARSFELIGACFTMTLFLVLALFG